jgi:phosphate transport system substrate-binding protein
VVPIFNLTGVSQDLRLTPELLANIYLGKITRWNDPKIREFNRGVPLPDRAIVVVHRSDSSGTTYAFSEYLSGSSEQWRTSVGKGLTIRWPAGNGAETNEGVAKLVQQTDGAIGYVEFLYAVRNRLGVIALRNHAGHFVRADLESVVAAASTTAPGVSPAAGGVIVDASGAKAYPLSTFTFILLLRDAPADSKRKLLLDFLDWALDSGQRQAAGLGYVAIPPAVSSKARSSLRVIN